MVDIWMRRESFIIIDRVRDMQTTKTGEKFSPTYIEGRLKFSPFIKDAMVIGNEKAFRYGAPQYGF